MQIPVEAKHSREEKQEIESRLLWSHDFPGAVVYLELTPNGLIYAVAREGKKKKSPRSHFLLNEKGEVFWKGSVKTTALIADDPHAIVMEVLETGLVLKGVASSGTTRWHYPLKGIPASTISDALSKTLVMVVLPYEWAGAEGQAQPADAVALDLTTGRERWSTQLGEISGSMTSFGSEFAVHENNVWWAAGGRAACLDLESGEPYWNVPIKANEEADSVWDFSTDRAVVVKGGEVTSFSREGGLEWQRELREEARPNGLGIASSGVVASVFTKKEAALALLDTADGNPLWIKSFKHKTKKLGPPPRGIAVNDASVALAIGKNLLGFSLLSGKELFKHKIKKRIFLGLEELRPFKNHLVLIGAEGAAGHALMDGHEIWKQDDFIDPVFEMRKTREATLALGMSGLSGGTAPGAQKAWKDYQSGSRDFTNAAMEASFQQGLYSQQQREKMRRASSNMSNAIGRFMEIDIQLVNRGLGPDYAEFYRHRGMTFIKLKQVSALDAALLNLETGEMEEAGVCTPGQGCISQMLVDPQRNRVIQAFRQATILCKEENLIKVYRFSP